MTASGRQLPEVLVHGVHGLRSRYRRGLHGVRAELLREWHRLRTAAGPRCLRVQPAVLRKLQWRILLQSHRAGVVHGVRRGGKLQIVSFRLSPHQRLLLPAKLVPASRHDDAVPVLPSL